MRLLRFSAAVCLVTASACTADHTAFKPAHLPESFAHLSEGTAAHWPSTDWYQGFGSRTLDALVATAQTNNWDLGAARARVLQADARARQAGAVLLPSLDAVGNGTYYAGHSSQGGGHELDWSAMLSASYELDFWGKNRATALSARLLSDASRAERDTLALTTLAGVASSYFRALAIHERLQIAESNRDAARQVMEVIQARFDAGVASPVEVASQKSALDSAQIAIFDFRQAETEAIASLSLLLGQLPEEFEFHAETMDSLQEPLPSPGLPSDLLARRPDIYLAEANLRAAHADVTVARAAMFPNISLTAAAGVANPALPATVLTIPGIGPSLALGGNLTQPIFDHGRLKAQHDEASAKETELLATYRSAIIAAFTDVENALGAVDHLNQAREAQHENLAESERAFAGAKARYEAGSGDFLTLLEAQRNLYAVRDQFVQYRLARLEALVSLCKALGGGWTGPTTIAATTAMESRP